MTILLKSDGGIPDTVLPYGVLTPEQIHRLRKTFAIVERQSHVAALVFYRHLFELDPALRPLFKTDIEEQAAKLMEMLGSSLSLLEKPEQLSAILEALGARHVGYGVEDRHYATVGVALLAMFESILASQWDGETRQAWLSFYQMLSSTMLKGAAKARA